MPFFALLFLFFEYLPFMDLILSIFKMLFFIWEFRECL